MTNWEPDVALDGKIQAHMIRRLKYPKGSLIVLRQCYPPLSQCYPLCEWPEKGSVLRLFLLR